MFKKIISVLLITAIMISTVTIGVSATETNTNNTTADLTNDNVEFSGSNSFGNLVSESIGNYNDEMAENSDYRITGLEITANIATVRYEVSGDCTVVVGIYDEETEQMLGSGKSAVTKDKYSVDLEIVTDAMPQYFVAKAFIIDGNNNPLSSAFTSEMYTQAIQEVKQMTADQFDSDRVLKLEESNETNFAVYADDVKVVDYQEGNNVPVTVDSENGKYVFSNATADLTALTAGDTFSYAYDEKNVLIVKVASISVDGDTVTITEAEADIEEVFDYVKIETAQDAGTCEVDESTLDEGVTYNGISEPEAESVKGDKESVGAVSDKVSIEKKFEYSLVENDDDAKVQFNGDLSLGVTMELKFYVSFKKVSIDFSIEYGADYTISLTVQSGDAIDKALAKLLFSPVTGVTIEVTPKVVLEAEITVSLSLSFTGKFGFSASTKGGVENTSEKPKSSAELKLEGEIFLGIALEPAIVIVNKKIAVADVEGTAGIKATVESNANDDEDHACKLCYEIKLFAVFSLEGSVKIFKKKLGSFGLEKEIDIVKFYSSKDFDDFGKGDCPHKKSEIDTTEPTEPTNSPSPTNPDTTNPTTKPDVTVPDTTEPTTTSPPPIATGKCGENATGELYDDGTLVISGTGKMYDYDRYYTRPFWSEYNSLVQKIIIKDGIKNIGSYAFYPCYSLKSITIPNSVTSIGDYAFWGCSISSITIPNSVKTIGNSAFSCCRNLTSITIPDGVTSIGSDAFYDCDRLSRITIPESVRSIGKFAFDDCFSLISITIPNSVTSIGEGAFRECERLKSVTLPNNITSINNRLFEECENLTSITIPDSVKTIGNSAFYGCRHLTSVNIPNNVTSIGYNAFYDCRDLTSITIPDGITSIESHTFYDCYSLTSITIPDSVTSIGNNAFWNCSGLTSMTIPDSVTSIGTSSFSSCSNLSNISVSTNNLNYKDIDGVLYNKAENNLILYPAKKSDISYTIPDSVTIINSYAFKGCNNLTSIKISDNITEIYENTFSYCNNLTSIEIPDSVTSIGTEAFFGCHSLTSITIPNSVTSIDNHAFASCQNLSTIYFCGDAPEINAYVFYLVDATAYYPKNNSTWTNDKLQNYNGTITWAPYTPGTELTSEILPSANVVQSSNATTKSFAFESLVAYEEYLIVAVKSESATDLLAPENLLYIDQRAADISGKIAFDYIPIENSESIVTLAFGPNKANLSKAEITVSDIAYNGKAQAPTFNVSHAGKTLVKDVDYTVSGDLSVTDRGTYSLTFTGINDYTGIVTVDYVVYSEQLLGDVNMDGVITVADATLVQKMVAQLETMSSDQSILADVDNNGTVNVNDVTCIQKYIASYGTGCGNTGNKVKI